MKLGIAKIYDLLLENIPRKCPDTKITVQELKSIGDTMYMYMINNVSEIEEMRRNAGIK